MLKYVAVAAALKFFSCGTAARKAYRVLGNLAGGKARRDAPMPSYYLERIKWKADLCRKYDILRDGGLVLELGTGWVHWEAITLRLFWDINAILYDVWDNRQLGALMSFLRQVDSAFEKGYTIDGMDMGRARRLLRQILEVESFEELYRLLGFRYVLDPSGNLSSLEDVEFDLVVSAGVFEHIYRQILPEFIARWARLMAPGGFAIHSINISDHLNHYDPRVSPKQYLAYDERVWRLFFENDVQYINRVQRCEWLEMFGKAGLTLREEDGTFVDLGNLKISKRYANMDLPDLKCTTLEVVLQKPPSA
jgi:SAM-dependent methyltransferase